jgi:hypothetical protein
MPTSRTDDCRTRLRARDRREGRGASRPSLVRNNSADPVAASRMDTGGTAPSNVPTIVSTPQRPHSFLLIRRRHLGDVILCTPAIRQVRRAFPSASIHFLTEYRWTDALATNPHLDDVIGYDPTRRWSDRLPRIHALRSARYDAVLDLQSVPSTAILTLASGAPRRIGLERRGPRNFVYSDLVPRTEQAGYSAAVMLKLLSKAGVSADMADLGLEAPSTRRRPPLG